MCVAWSTSELKSHTCPLGNSLAVQAGWQQGLGCAAESGCAMVTSVKAATILDKSNSGREGLIQRPVCGRGTLRQRSCGITSAVRKQIEDAGAQLAFFLFTLAPHSMGWCCPHCSLYFPTMLNPM